ncbi:ester cyclase [Pricia sp.]|uniref:ester cyclase n=1 Tax=Pricia sp. TaxID=2268138 RepID=UPI00359417A2
MKKSALLFIVVFALLSVYCMDPERKNTDVVHAMDKEKELKTASENYLRAWSDWDTTLMETTVIRNMVRNVNGEIASSNPSGLAEALQFWHTAIPDFKVVPREIIVVGNRTYTNWTCTGTHTGMFGHTPPTGKKSSTEGFSILTFDDRGKLVHESAYYDLLGVMQDWGYTVTAPVME